MVTACNYMTVSQAVFFAVYILSFIVTIHAAKHLNANGPFGKRHEFNNEPSPYACNRGAGISSSIFPPRRKILQDINVSKTIYSSSEKLQLSWTPIFASCKDDFIGIYSVEITDIAGKNIILS